MNVRQRKIPFCMKWLKNAQSVYQFTIRNRKSLITEPKNLMEYLVTIISFCTFLAVLLNMLKLAAIQRRILVSVIVIHFSLSIQTHLFWPTTFSHSKIIFRYKQQTVKFLVTVRAKYFIVHVKIFDFILIDVFWSL